MTITRSTHALLTATLLTLAGCATAGSGAAPGRVLEVAPDGAWTWFNDERAIVLRNGNTLAGYVREDGNIAVTNFDPRTGQRWESVLSGAGAVERDDHNNPSLTLLPDGRVLAVYSRHGTDNHYFWRLSNTPDPRGVEDWTEQRVREIGVRATYANTFRLADEGDTIYNFHRALNYNPTLSFSTDLGQSWGEPIPFIRAGDGRVRPYGRYTSNNRDRIDLIYTDAHPRNFDNSIYHLFYRDGAFRRTDGTVVKRLRDLPLSHDQGERGTVVYQYSDAPWGAGQGPDDYLPGGRGWTWDVAQGPGENPVVALQARRGEVADTGWRADRIYYYYARWDGSAWQKRLVAQGGRPLYPAERDYGGGMTIDPQDPDVVYLSSNALRPFDLSDLDQVPLNPEDRYRLYRGETDDGGRTFRWTEVAPEVTDQDKLRPHAVDNPDGPTPVLWFQGRYNTYRNYQARVMGLFPR